MTLTERERFLHLAFFGFPRALMGLQGWCMAFYDQPHLVQRMIADRVRIHSLPRPLCAA